MISVSFKLISLPSRLKWLIGEESALTAEGVSANLCFAAVHRVLGRLDTHMRTALHMTRLRPAAENNEITVAGSTCVQTVLF